MDPSSNSLSSRSSTLGGPSVGPKMEAPPSDTTVNGPDTNGKYSAVTVVTITDEDGNEKKFKINHTGIKVPDSITDDDKKEEFVKNYAQEAIANDENLQTTLRFAHSRLGSGGSTRAISLNRGTGQVTQKKVDKDNKTRQIGDIQYAISKTRSHKHFTQTLKAIRDATDENQLPPALRPLKQKIHNGTPLTARELNTIAHHPKINGEWHQYQGRYKDFEKFTNVSSGTLSNSPDIEYSDKNEYFEPLTFTDEQTIDLDTLDTKAAKWEKKENSLATTAKIPTLAGGSGITPYHDDYDYDVSSSSVFSPRSSSIGPRQSFQGIINFLRAGDSYQKSLANGFEQSLRNLSEEIASAQRNGNTQKADKFIAVQNGDPIACKDYAHYLMAQDKNSEAIPFLLYASDQLYNSLDNDNNRKQYAEASTLLGDCFVAEAERIRNLGYDDLSNTLYTTAHHKYMVAANLGDCIGALEAGKLFLKQNPPNVPAAKQYLNQAIQNAPPGDVSGKQARKLLKDLESQYPSTSLSQPNPLHTGGGVSGLGQPNPLPTSHYQPSSASYEQHYAHTDEDNPLNGLVTSLKASDDSHIQKMGDYLEEHITTDLPNAIRLADIRDDHDQVAFLERVKSGDPEACKKYARTFIKSGRTDLAIPFLLPAARNDDPEAQVLLGDCYFSQAQEAAKNGDGPVADQLHKKALAWFTKASQNGSSEGAYKAGFLQLNGLGVNSVRTDRAIKFLEQAKENANTHHSLENIRWGIAAANLLSQIRQTHTESMPQPDPLNIDQGTEQFISENIFLQKVESEHPPAQEAINFYKEKKYAEAYEQLKDLNAEQRGDQGNYYYGMILKYGLGGVEKNPKEADEIFSTLSLQNLMREDETRNEFEQAAHDELNKSTATADEAKFHIDQANEHLENGDVNQAINSFMEALTKNPSKTEERAIKYNLLKKLNSLSENDLGSLADTNDYAKMVQAYRKYHEINVDNLQNRKNQLVAALQKDDNPVEMLKFIELINDDTGNRGSAIQILDKLAFLVSKDNSLISTDDNEIAFYSDISQLMNGPLGPVLSDDDLERVETIINHLEGEEAVSAEDIKFLESLPDKVSEQLKIQTEAKVMVDILRNEKGNNEEIQDFIDEFDPHNPAHIKKLDEYEDQYIADKSARDLIADKVLSLYSIFSGNDEMEPFNQRLQELLEFKKMDGPLLTFSKGHETAEDIETAKLERCVQLLGGNFIGQVTPYLSEKDLNTLTTVMQKVRDKDSMITESENIKTMEILERLNDTETGIAAQREARQRFQEMQTAGFFANTNVKVPLRNGPLNEKTIANINDAYAYFTNAQVGTSPYQIIRRNLNSLSDTRLNLSASRGAQKFIFFEAGGETPKILGTLRAGEGTGLRSFLFQRGVLNQSERDLFNKFLNTPTTYLNESDRNKLKNIAKRKIEPFVRLINGNAKDSDLQAIKKLGKPPLSQAEIDHLKP